MTDFPSYRRPPVAEVVCGLQYTPLAQLHLAHVGRYWAEIQGAFPLVEEKLPTPHVVERVGGTSAAEAPRELLERMPWPRTWFMEEAKRRLIQVQRDKFIYNWRKLDPQDDYPRYQVISDEFFQHWRGFLDFLNNLSLPSPMPDLCELAYVNLIPRGQGWESIQDAYSLFSFVDWPGQMRFLPVPGDVRCLLQFEMPDNSGRLHVDLSLARWDVTGDLPVLRLSLMARGRPVEEVSSDSLRSWFDVAHEWIVRGFVDLVDRRTDDLWERET